MATAKKKTAFKKATKKPAKKVTKLSRRKTKTVEQVTAEADLSQKDYDLQVDADPRAEQATDSYANSYGQTEQAQPEIDFTKIGIIDMRAVSFVDRAVILTLLASTGYISTHLHHLTDDWNTLSRFLQAETLRLNHTNKLVSPETWLNARNSFSISAPRISSEVFIGFNEPGPAIPETLDLFGGSYVRVG